MPRALLSRDQKNLLPKRYSMLTIMLTDSRHGVTKYPRATLHPPDLHPTGLAHLNVTRAEVELTVFGEMLDLVDCWRIES